ncbi:DUF4825 domain-containing protein [Clostridium sp. MSJ-11]|uniref:DUF4825 domain-containing protein n=1 Tax=Clostridium mobile TaxID=2841512 RepID=A0ABS6EHP2_9CLOT|nr:DUF4825 domain-containing protein [Clostridium mobile]MBU5483985.1 DUF4825 domain-containing protein [Clostridium mobile]
MVKRRNFIIIILLVFGISAFGITEFIIKPRQEEKRAKYRLEQQNSLTHDFKGLFKYKTKYMGDSSNIVNLNYSLPLGNVPRTNEIDSDNLEYIINYEESALKIGKEKVKTDLIYNATANFALIDNLEAITFNFTDSSYKIARNDVEDWYKIDLSSLVDETKWSKEIQEKLEEKNYVDEFWKANFMEIKDRVASSF